MPLLVPNRIDTERLLVRPVVDADLPALMAINSDAAVTALLPDAAWTSMADADNGGSRKARPGMSRSTACGAACGRVPEE